MKSPLNELKLLAEQNLIELNKFNIVSDALTLKNTSIEKVNEAFNVVKDLFKNHLISRKTFHNFKSAFKKADTPEITKVVIAGHKPLRGYFVGFLITFFLNFFGLIIALFKGDEKCKISAIRTFIALLIVTALTFLIGFLVVSYLKATGNLPLI